MTDANAVLGRVDPDWFAGGHMTLDITAARAAMGDLAAELALDPVALAGGICDVANAKMAQAIRTLTVEHGREPREFTLLAFGGAGPMHAVEIARELGVEEVVVPLFPGAFSAWGMLGTAVRRDLTRQFFTPGHALDSPAMASALAGLEAQGLAALDEQGVPAERRAVEHAVDMRYEGQDYTLTVPLTGAAEPLTDGFHATVSARFAAQHERRYGHATPQAPIEFVTLRTTALGAPPVQETRPYAPEADDAPRAGGTKPVVFGGETYETPVLRREHLPVGEQFPGPAIVVEATSTTVVPPDALVTVDMNGFLVIKLGGAA
ncbi:hydantoinase/oxoprolinase family protein [Streptomyces aureus]|uniref:hydantoinase/oxoprolinase family protein n=1 Tax=Streptomyces aureus TaxID=193461 RepID=UPI003CD091AF